MCNRVSCVPGFFSIFGAYRPKEEAGDHRPAPPSGRGTVTREKASSYVLIGRSFGKSLAVVSRIARGGRWERVVAENAPEAFLSHASIHPPL